jgi:murein DD-endopeptidase MepM/ murein hydrolase activator NlpD
METIRVKRLFLFLALLSFAVSAATPSFERIRKDSTKKQSPISKLRTRIKKLEEKLGKTNADYVSNLERKKDIEIQIAAIEADIVKNTNEVKTLSSEVLKGIEGYALATMEEHDPSALLEARMVEKGLKQKYELATREWEEGKRINLRLDLLRKEHVEILATEQNLESLIQEMENDKRKLVERWPKASNVREQVSLASIDGFTSGTLPFGGLFFPVQDFVEMKPERLGVNFVLNQSRPVRAVGKGKVVYAGELSNLGNVVIIDHGDDVRTVYLGPFRPTVKKEENVETAAIIGHLLETGGAHSQLYFEIRRKNIAQNTILWFNKNASR